jgi:two-component system, OmpR family, response regulator
LTAREFQLLECLAKSHDKVVSRATILSQVWGVAADVSDNAVDVYVSYLRRKLGLGDQLVTVRGLGFKLSTRGQLSRRRRRFSGFSQTCCDSLLLARE